MCKEKWVGENKLLAIEILFSPTFQNPQKAAAKCFALKLNDPFFVASVECLKHGRYFKSGAKALRGQFIRDTGLENCKQICKDNPRNGFYNAF